MKRSHLHLAVIFAVLAIVTFQRPYSNTPPIRSDGVCYHAWTRALLTWDFTFCNLVAPNMEGFQYYFSNEDRARGICQNTCPPGVALIRLPLMAPFVDTKSQQFTIGPQEHRMCLLAGAAALLLTCIFCLLGMKRLGVTDEAAAWALGLGVFGTGLFHYATYDASFSHIFSAMTISALTYVLIANSRNGLGFGGTVLCFFLSALLVLIRNTNLVVLAWGMAALVFFAKRNRHLPGKLASLGFGAILGEGIQLWYNYYATAQFRFSSYGEQFFIWSRPMWKQVLFSYERGLFTYYPFLLIPIVAGLIWKSTRSAAVLVAGLMFTFALLYGFWDCWFLGCGFGHRGFVELVPFAILLFGLLLERQPKVRAYLVTLGIVCALMTLTLMWAYWRGSLPMEGTTAEIFWSRLTPGL